MMISPGLAPALALSALVSCASGFVAPSSLPPPPPLSAPSRSAADVAVNRMQDAAVANRMSLPVELTDTDTGGYSRLGLARQAAEAVAAQQKMSETTTLGLASLDLAGGALWGVVLWFGLFNDILFPKAARPADLLMPSLGRLLGFNETEAWLVDRTEGLSSPVPPALLGIMVPLFYAAGLAVQVRGEDAAPLLLLLLRPPRATTATNYPPHLTSPHRWPSRWCATRRP